MSESECSEFKDVQNGPIFFSWQLAVAIDAEGKGDGYSGLSHFFNSIVGNFILSVRMCDRVAMGLVYILFFVLSHCVPHFFRWQLVIRSWVES